MTEFRSNLADSGRQWLTIGRCRANNGRIRAKWTTSGPNWPKSGQSWSCPGRVWPMSGRSWLNLDPVRLNSGDLSLMPGQPWSSHRRIRGDFGPNLDHVRPHLAEFQPKLVDTRQLRQKSSRSLGARATTCSVRPDLARTKAGADSAELSHLVEWGEGWGSHHPCRPRVDNHVHCLSACHPASIMAVHPRDVLDNVYGAPINCAVRTRLPGTDSTRVPLVVLVMLELIDLHRDTCRLSCPSIASCSSSSIVLHVVNRSNASVSPVILS